MKRSELEHVLRAAGAITGVSTWVVIGSQAILASPADLAISKLVAWREKDREFVKALVQHRIVKSQDLQALLDELTPDVAERVRGRLTGISSQ